MSLNEAAVQQCTIELELVCFSCFMTVQLEGGKVQGKIMKNPEFKIKIRPNTL